MPEQTLLETTLEILEGNADIPHNISARMLMAALRHINTTARATQDCVNILTGRVETLEKKENTRADTETLREERRVTWPYILEKFGAPFVMTIVAILVTLVITGFFTQP